MKKIKKFFLAIFVLLLLIVLASCKNNEEPPEIHEEAKETHPLDKNLKLNLNGKLNESYREPSMHPIYEMEISALISIVANGYESAIYVEFESDNYYYACAYREKEPEKDENATYTWIGYNHASEIKEYNGKERLIATYQINYSSPGEDIFGLIENKPVLEYAHKHKTNFVDDINIEEPMQYEGKFIHMMSSKSNIECCYSPTELHVSCSALYTEIDGEIYFAVKANSEEQLKYELYKYYDELSAKVIRGQYETTDYNGKKNCYGLLKLEDVKDVLLREAEIRKNENND